MTALRATHDVEAVDVNGCVHNAVTASNEGSFYELHGQGCLTTEAGTYKRLNVRSLRALDLGSHRPDGGNLDLLGPPAGNARSGCLMQRTLAG